MPIIKDHLIFLHFEKIRTIVGGNIFSNFACFPRDIALFQIFPTYLEGGMVRALEIAMLLAWRLSVGWCGHWR